MFSDALMFKLTIQAILKNPLGFDWTLQGFGMLRLYLTPAVRLHVWSADAKVPEVSELHDHPWSFSSLIIAGRLVNTRYAKIPHATPNFMEQTILCGEGGGLRGSPSPVYLSAQPSELYLEGDSYFQSAPEIHRSAPEDGTVTLIERRFEWDRDHACVYWRKGEEWVSAEPRPATPDEVLRITRNSLDKWFKEES